MREERITLYQFNEYLFQPYFYERFWFLLLCGVELIFIGFSAYRYKIRRLRAREAKLITLVVERTEHLQQGKENVELTRREAEQQKMIAEESNKVKTELLNIAAHNLKSLLLSM